MPEKNTSRGKMKHMTLLFFQGLAMAMQKNHEGPAVFEMLNKALDVARHEKRITEERNIRILIAQMHVAKVPSFSLFSFSCSNWESCLLLYLSSFFFSLGRVVFSMCIGIQIILSCLFTYKLRQTHQFGIITKLIKMRK